ncbi:MAG TPA: rhodanese-like domain-containing protein [Chromatiales bacterium]|nr:rhodanese-like domain-containing protein [Chromatiales bacterium]
MKVTARTVISFFCVLFVLVLAACSPPESVNTIKATDLQSRIEQGDTPLILDVRRPSEYAEGHVSGAVNIPRGDLEDRLAELGPDRGREIVVYCKSGMRAAMAEKELVEAGFTNVLDLDGHMQGWEEAGLPVEHPDAGD